MFDRENSYEAIFNSAVDAIVVIDSNSIIHSWNKGAQNLMGWTAEEMLGKKLEVVIPDRYRKAHIAGVKRYMESKVPKVIGLPFVRLASLHKDGHEVPTNFSVATWTENGDTYFTAIMRDVTETVEHENQQDLFIRELNHRVKNTLAVVSGIINQTVKHSNNLDEFQDSLQNRIEGMSKVHDLLVATNWNFVTLHGLLDIFLEPYGHKYLYDGPEVEIKPNIAVTFGMAIQELATNCIKYGAWSEGGNVLIFGNTVDNEMNLTWREKGGPMIVAPEEYGFGLVLLDRVVASAVRGKTTISFDPDGFRYEVVCPLSKDIIAIK